MQGKIPFDLMITKLPMYHLIFLRVFWKEEKRNEKSSHMLQVVIWSYGHGSTWTYCIESGPYSE